MLQLRIRADKTGEQPESGRWPVDRVELAAEAPKDHNFADTFVARALADGYLEFENPRAVTSPVPEGVEPYDRDPVITGDAIILRLHGGDLHYRVLEPPGKYADEAEPSGWRVSHEYQCRLARKKG